MTQLPGITVTFKEYEGRIGELMDRSRAENIPIFIKGSSGKIVATLYCGKVDLLEFGDDDECPQCNRDKGHDFDCPIEKRDQQKFDAGWKAGVEAERDRCAELLGIAKWKGWNGPAAQVVDSLRVIIETEEPLLPPSQQVSQPVEGNRDDLCGSRQHLSTGEIDGPPAEPHKP